jgi:hypothetical protein
MRQLAVVTFLVLATVTAVAEDKLVLKDGQVVTGEIISVSRGDVQIRSGGETIRVPRWAIEKMEREGTEGQVETLEPADIPRRGKPRRVLPSPSLVNRDIPEATPEVLAWVDVCIQKLASQDEGVSKSAIAALRYLGPTARPALEEAAAGDDETTARNAEKVLAHIDRVEARIAEQKSGEGQNRRRSAATLSKTLGLSDEQVPEFKAILDDHYRKQTALARSVRKGDVERDDANRQLVQLRADVEEKLAKVLTKEQMERFVKTVPRPGTEAASP